MRDVSTEELLELDGLVPKPTDREQLWAIREATVVDPGTDSPAVKLIQRRRTREMERRKAAAERSAESPLEKFARVWA